MRNTLLFLCSLSFSLSIISCQWQPQPTATETVEIDSRVPRYTIQQELYDAASPEETSVEISIPELRATLLNGENQVIFETDISTGIDGVATLIFLPLSSVILLPFRFCLYCYALCANIAQDVFC